MKIKVLVLILAISTILTTDAYASKNFVDFSGHWRGYCSLNGGAESPSVKQIQMTDDKAIQINNMNFDLTKPTLTNLSDEDQGAPYNEVTVYDFQWPADKTQIEMIARWVGWYTANPGSWLGEGNGVIKIENDALLITRNFNGQSEVCSYTRD